ncbi:MAG TPA: fumarylacetoacetate hydrolase family protein [Actinomycetales bacterium]|nr:fumarylacetoacetate hydrolase family protein [Actinomycetales bacterium]
MDVITATLGSRPGKIVAVHLSYRSRAEQRGRVPANPSYFLKASSSLIGSGDVVRPEGTELLGFEGEIVAVIGTQAKDVSPEDGWKHVGWITAGNDLGLHDMRVPDKGSNVRSKSGDGFSAVGPNLIEASKVREDGIRVRTWLDGELVQDDTSAGMLWPIGLMVADLSRFMTLEVGDLIYTGVPTGASVAVPGQVVEVEVSSLDDESLTSGRLVTTVVSGPPLAPWGDAPYVDDKQRSDAWGYDVTTESGGTDAQSGGVEAQAESGGAEAEAEFELTAELRERLMNVSNATLSSLMRKKGYNEVSIDGVRPLIPGSRIVGRARTLRYLPYRKDEFAARGGGYNAQKRAIDSVNEGEILVMDARRVNDAGTLGDILALRAQTRGCVGVITDGCVRDYSLVANQGMPVWAAGPHPAVLGRRHIPWDIDVDIQCGGALVRPGDVIVADDDGPLVIPPHLVEELVGEAEQQEDEEVFIAQMVAAGESVDGLYPLGTAWRERYEQWVADGRPSTTTK